MRDLFGKAALSLLGAAMACAGAQAFAYGEADGDYRRALDPALGIAVQFGRWDGTINLVYDPDNAPALFADTATVLALLEEAAGDWALVSGIGFNVVDSDSNIPNDDGQGPNGKDGLVRVYWGNTGGAAGVAGPDADFYDPDRGYYPYIDGSVTLNIDESIWDSATDLVDVLVHELGHLMGLGHSDNPDSVMFANPYNHLLHPRGDDILAARALYGDGTLVIDDVSAPVAQWLFQPLPAAPASALEYLFKPNQATDQGAFISVGNDTPVTVITGGTQDGEFVRFNYGGIGNFSNNTDIDIDAELVFVDPFGYLYERRAVDIDCDAGFACGGGWNSIAKSHALKTIPGEWTAYIEDTATQATLLEMSFNVATTNSFNRAPVAEVTVTGLSGTQVNVELAVTDADSDIIDVVWHPHGILGDQDNDGFLDTGVTDTVQAGATLDRDVTFLAPGSHTLYIELYDDDATYDAAIPDSGGAGDGFRSLIAITVDLPVNSEDDVLVRANFVSDSLGGGSGGGSQVVNAIGASTSLQQVTTSDGSLTSAGFGAGASADNGASTATSFTGGTLITIAGSVTPQAADVGKGGEIFVVLYTDSALTYLDVDGNYRAWNGSLKTIEPAFEVASLKSLESFEVFTGNVQGGIYRIFLGYRLTAGGPLHFNAKAFRVTVN